MSKPSAPRKFLLAGSIVALAVFAALGIAAAASLRAHRGTATTEHAAAVSVQAPALTAPNVTAQQSGKGDARVRASVEALPLAFEANQGQTDPQVRYMARGNGYTVFLTANDTVFALQSSSPTAGAIVAGKHRVTASAPAKEQSAESAEKERSAAIHMHLIGGNPQSQIIGESQLPGHSNYFIGNDRSQWHADVSQYARISYRDTYPGINMAFYGVQKQLEFDFIVAPGAIPAAIRLGVSGAQRIATDDAGNLILKSAAGDVLLHKPFAYQQRDGVRQRVDARFVLESKNQVSFELGNYDHSRELVIDPSVSYATYLGGTAEDDGYAIAIDGSGNAYVTGQTKSTDFPIKNALQGTDKNNSFDVFVTELSPTGALIYSTYIGGSSDDSGNAIAVDGSGNAFVAGGTASSDFPTHAGAYQSTLRGALNAFVFELNPTGSALTYSTFIGGTGSDVANGLALGSGGNAYVVGSTTSTDFPTKNAIALETAGGFVAVLNPNGSALVYSTYLGASSADFAAAVAVDGTGNAYVTGATQTPTFKTTAGVVQTTCGSDGNCNGGLYDAFVCAIPPTGSTLLYSTFLGGERADQGLGIAVDSAGDAYVTGFTQSTLFPTTNAAFAALGGLQDAFVTALSPTGTARLYSTYLGGSGADAGSGIAVDGSKNAYVTGQTASANFPVGHATQSTIGGGNDAFITEVAPAGTLVFSTFLGGSSNENSRNALGSVSPVGGIAVDSAGANIYVAGNTASSNFPVTSGASQATLGGAPFDAFVVKYSQAGAAANFTITNGALSTTSGAAGVSATSNITVTSINNFNSAVALACTVAPVVSRGPTCAFSNPGASVTPPPNASVTATLTVSTTPAAAAMLERPSDRRSSGFFYAMLLPVGGMALLGAGFGSAGTRRKKLFGFLMLGLLLSGLLLMPACGGNSGGGGGSGTPAGAYTITVTGTNNSAVATGSPALVLTVN